MPDFRKPGHLPNLRPDKLPPPPDWLPRQRRGTTPQMIGRYPDYDTLERRDAWDPVTRRVVEQRLEMTGRPLTFFSGEEEPTLRAFCDVCLHQPSEPRIPVAEMVDDQLASGRLAGYQYADMPDDRDTWHIVLAALDSTAKARHGCERFADCDAEAREAIVGEFAQAKVRGDGWDRLNVSHAWSVCMRCMIGAFYSHPWAWNEIGFGGPAYPEGYMRMGPVGVREPYEDRAASDEDPVRVADSLNDAR